MKRYLLMSTQVMPRYWCCRCTFILSKYCANAYEVPNSNKYEVIFKNQTFRVVQSFDTCFVEKIQMNNILIKTFSNHGRDIIN